MKRYGAFGMLLLLSLCMAGCGGPDGQTPEPVSDGALTVSDLHEIFASLDLSEASLSGYGETEEPCAAAGSARAGRHLETLRSFSWEEFHAPDGADWSGARCCELTAPGVTLTAVLSDYPQHLRVVTDRGGGMFTLPYIADGPDGETVQSSRMLYELFDQWYGEAHAAALWGGNGTPLTGEELDWFADYAACERTFLDEAGNEYCKNTEISCFFTSRYSDPRDMDPEEFLRYCPAQTGVKDEEEFSCVQAVRGWRGEDGQLLTLNELPVPCWRLPRSRLNELLTRYAGITVEEMRADWLTEALYVPETDCFYTFTSDYGPGSFFPCYGEKTGEGIVTLWSAPRGESGLSDRLVLQKSGENWQIRSFQKIDAEGNPAP